MAAPRLESCTEVEDPLAASFPQPHSDSSPSAAGVHPKATEAQSSHAQTTCLSGCRSTSRSGPCTSFWCCSTFMRPPLWSTCLQGIAGGCQYAWEACTGYMPMQPDHLLTATVQICTALGSKLHTTVGSCLRQT